ncbi:hypothetical protein B7486_09020 [cyanobacterium TDX16]|nr:hypothetical protein B7486_09020 [cyanobacterium TDX16]
MSATLASNLAAISAFKQAGAEGEHAVQIVSFRLAGELYGIDIMCVKEIIPLGPVTKLPEVPDFVRGLMNHNGQVIPVIDLRKRLGLATPVSDEQSPIVVAKVNTKTIGLVVDTVNGVLHISEDDIDPAPSGIAGIDHDYVSGLVKCDAKLMILLNIDSMLISEGTKSLSTPTA